MKTILLAAAAATVFVVVGSALGASAGDPPTLIYACKHPSSGWLRQVSGPAQCRRRETPVSWNIEGAKGDKGDAGAPGAAGAAWAEGGQGRSGHGRLGAQDARGRSLHRRRLGSRRDQGHGRRGR